MHPLARLNELRVNVLDYAAFPDQRQALIRELLQRKGRVVCVELSAQLGVRTHNSP